MYTNSNLRKWQTASDMIHGFLKNGESLLWSGQPLKGLRLQTKDAFLIPFSIFWCGFAIFWELMALGILFRKNSFGGSTSLVSGIFPLFGLPFVIIGLYLLFGRFIVDALRRKKTYYGVTEQRILIIIGSSSQKVRSFDLKSLTNVNMIKKRDGSGTITFSAPQAIPAYSSNTSRPRPNWNATAMFELIPNVSDVYQIIIKAQHKTNENF